MAALTKPRKVWLAALAALGVSLLVAFFFLVLRDGGGAPRELTVLPEVAEKPSAAAAVENAAADRATAPALIRVYVAGAVKTPGVFPLQEGERLVDAVRAAGGAAPGADLEAVNLALRVQDEGYYFIPARAAPTANRESVDAAASSNGAAPAIPAAAANPSTNHAHAPGGTAQSGNGGELVNLNTADRQELESLPGIGPARADAIIAYREEHGYFVAIEEITAVSGIGEGIFANLQHLVTVSE